MDVKNKDDTAHLIFQSQSTCIITNYVSHTVTTRQSVFDSVDENPSGVK